MWHGTSTHLAAADIRRFNARVIAPFASVVKVSLARFHHAPMACIARSIFMMRDVQLRALIETLLAVHPLDSKPFLLEQTLVVGHELGQSLKRSSGFQSQCLHTFSPWGIGNIILIQWLAFERLSNAIRRATGRNFIQKAHPSWPQVLSRLRTPKKPFLQ